MSEELVEFTYALPLPKVGVMVKVKRLIDDGRRYLPRDYVNMVSCVASHATHGNKKWARVPLNGIEYDFLGSELEIVKHALNKLYNCVPPHFPKVLKE